MVLSRPYIVKASPMRKCICRPFNLHTESAWHASSIRASQEQMSRGVACVSLGIGVKVVM